MNMGASGAAGSGLILDPEKGREDLKPYNTATAKILPGTLNTQCVIPVAVMALAYISSIDVDLTTLIVAILAQVIGAYIGLRYVVKMNVSLIKKFISASLLIAATLIKDIMKEGRTVA